MCAIIFLAKCLKTFKCNPLLWNSFDLKSVYSTAASKKKIITIKENHYIQAFPSLCIQSDSNNANITTSKPPLESIPLSLWMRHHSRWSESQGCMKLGWVPVHQCTDYLTVGVLVWRKWPGFVGRGGLIPREGVCAGFIVLSTLKVFISWATRPRPAQIGALPDVLGSSELAFWSFSDSPISGRKRKQHTTVYVLPLKPQQHDLFSSLMLTKLC